VAGGENFVAHGSLDSGNRFHDQSQLTGKLGHLSLTYLNAGKAG
jgi:hypothetical protein